MNSETIGEITVICCLLLVVAFFAFQAPFFAFLMRLAKIEIPSTKNQPKKVKSIAPPDIKPWPWYKVWIRTLFRPTVNTGESLLSEAKISLRQAFLSLVLAVFIEASLYWSILFFKQPIEVNWQNIIKPISDMLQAFVLPFFVFIFYLVIHFIAKLFRGKGSLRDLFVVSSAFFSPLWILYGISMTVGFLVFKFEPFLVVSAFLEFYWLLVINLVIIKTVYRFPWIGACSINLLIIVLGSIFLLIEFANNFNHNLPYPR